MFITPCLSRNIFLEACHWVVLVMMPMTHVMTSQNGQIPGSTHRNERTLLCLWWRHFDHDQNSHCFDVRSLRTLHDVIPWDLRKSCLLLRCKNLWCCIGRGFLRQQVAKMEPWLVVLYNHGVDLDPFSYPLRLINFDKPWLTHIVNSVVYTATGNDSPIHRWSKPSSRCMTCTMRDILPPDDAIRVQEQLRLSG